MRRSTLTIVIAAAALGSVAPGCGEIADAPGVGDSGPDMQSPLGFDGGDEAQAAITRPQLCRSGAHELVDQSDEKRQNSTKTQAGRTVVGQTFKTSRHGALTAIEIAAYRCDRTKPGRLRMTVFEGRGVDGATLATAELEAPAAEQCDLIYLPLLDPVARGPATFDLTNSCVEVQVDHDYTFLVEALDPTESFMVGQTAPSGVGARFDAYPRGGAMIEDEPGMWTLVGDLGLDATFKAYVEP